MSRLACFLIVVACSATNGSSHMPIDAPAQGSSSDGVTIAAANVHLTGSDSMVPPSTQGMVLVAIDITVTNAGTKPGFFASLNPADFSLETTAGVAFAASAVTSEQANACKAAASVGPEAMATCTAVFEVDSTMLSQVIYMLPDGTTATAAASLSSTMPGGAVLGTSCANASCPSPFVCVTGAHSQTCEATCTTGSAVLCGEFYSGSGTLSCVPGSNSAFCIVECTPGTDQCPGILTCSAGSGESRGICDAP